MLTVLSIIFPVFAVMGLAYVVVLKGLFDQAEIRTLGKYVLNIAFPAMLFNTVATRDLSWRGDYHIADSIHPDHCQGSVPRRLKVGSQGIGADFS